MALKFNNPFHRDNPEPSPPLRERAASIPSKAMDGTMKLHEYNKQHPYIFNHSQRGRIREM